MLAGWTASVLATCIGGGGRVPSLCFDAATARPVSFDGLPLAPGSGINLEDCHAKGAPSLRVAPHGSAQSTECFICSPNYYHDVVDAEACVTSAFTADEESGAIDWQVRITSSATTPWSTPLIASLGHAFDAASTRVWTAGPHALGLGLPNATYNPFAPLDVVSANLTADARFLYGGHLSNIDDPLEGAAPATALPVVVKIDEGDDTAISLLQSLDDTPVVAYAQFGLDVTAKWVWTNFSRAYHRLGGSAGGAPAEVRFSQHLISHAGCWRPAVAFLQRQYPAYFEPRPDVVAAAGPAFEGGGAYADLRGIDDINASLMKQWAPMNFRLNWDSTARFPFHGEWMPTAADGFGDTWLTCFIHTKGDSHIGEGCMNISSAAIASWYATAKEYGVSTCTYGNLFEFGWYGAAALEPSAAAECDGADSQHGGRPPFAAARNYSRELLCRTRQLLQSDAYGRSLMRAVRGNRTRGSGCEGFGAHKYVCGGLAGSMIMDPHPDLPYLKHVLDMARTSMARMPSSGVCIDRQDWVGSVNPDADDGVTWYPLVPRVKYGPVRAMINSWKPAMAAFASVWHSQSQSVIINNHVSRIDMMEHVDGIYAESADIIEIVLPETDMGPEGNNGWAYSLMSALTALNKPLWLWNHPKKLTFSLDYIEQALQAHLLVGAYPMLPIRNNDHGIGGDCSPHCPWDPLYRMYGHLFGALAGKRWVLTAHAVAASSGQANLFQTTAHGGGFAVPITQGEAANATVTLNLPAGTKVRAVTVLHPSAARQHGGGSPTPIPYTLDHDHRLLEPAEGRKGARTVRVTIEAPLVRRCAVVLVLIL